MVYYCGCCGCCDCSHVSNKGCLASLCVYMWVRDAVGQSQNKWNDRDQGQHTWRCGRAFPCPSPGMIMDHEMTMKSLVCLIPNTHKTWPRHNCPVKTTGASAPNQNESRRRIEGCRWHCESKRRRPRGCCFGRGGRELRRQVCVTWGWK